MRIGQHLASTEEFRRDPGYQPYEFFDSGAVNSSAYLTLYWWVIATISEGHKIGIRSAKDKVASEIERDGSSLRAAVQYSKRRHVTHKARIIVALFLKCLNHAAVHL